MSRHIVSVDDLTDNEIDWILSRAADLEGGQAQSVAPKGLVGGLLFAQTSLRTRVGYASAMAQLGWHQIDVLQRRHDATSMIESWDDTLRTLSAYIDVLVGRPGEDLSREILARSLSVPYINGGSTGSVVEHPTQALIDLCAIERVGPIGDLTVALVGDLRMRAARSLVRLLARKRPYRTVVCTVSDLDDRLYDEVGLDVELRPLTDLGEADVLYVIGIPHQAVPEDVRDTLRVTKRVVSQLPRDSVVLSPLPVIDEIDGEARRDPRIRMFEQSAAGSKVRRAVLEFVLTR